MQQQSVKRGKSLVVTILLLLKLHLVERHLGENGGELLVDEGSHLGDRSVDLGTLLFVGAREREEEDSTCNA